MPQLSDRETLENERVMVSGDHSTSVSWKWSERHWLCHGGGQRVSVIAAAVKWKWLRVIVFFREPERLNVL